MSRPHAAVALAIAAVAAAGVANFALYTLVPLAPWLHALDLVLDLAALAAVVALLVWAGQRFEATEARAREAIAASQARLAAIIDTAMDAIVTVDEAQRIVLFNQAAERVFRCPRAEALGARLDRFIPVRFREAHRVHLERFAASGATGRRMGDGTTLWGLRADGEEFPMEASISRSEEGGRRYCTVILRDITLRKRAEDALRAREAELRELSARVLEARDEEKALLSRELHDELGQLLTALKIDLAALVARLPAGDPAFAEAGARLHALVDRTVTATRRIAANLRPPMLDDLGLADTIGWLVDDFRSHSGLDCSLALPTEGALADVHHDVANTAYRVLQESLTNVARHAQATRAWVVIEDGGDALRLEVEDDGRGIGAADLAQPRSLGLKGMRERVAWVGGRLDIGRAPRGGTRVTVHLPKQPAARAT